MSTAGARDEHGEVVAVERIGDRMIEVTARLPHIARNAQPGQFAQLRCGEDATPLLRRPFSVAWTEDDLASFVFAPVGVGTRILAGLRPGDRLQALGPLGRGFTTDGDARRWVAVAGGLGCAPFPLLLRELRARGAADVRVISGAATAGQLYPPERYQRGDNGISIVELTIDGSRGTQGLVTDAIADHVDSATAVLACGPNPMLAALQRTLAGNCAPARAEASLEAPMGCGFGTCLGCALPVRTESSAPAWSLCCTDGPVMDMAQVAWEALMALPPAHVA